MPVTADLILHCSASGSGICAAARGLTLAELGARVGRAPSALSLLENGRREPKLSLIEALATALSVPAEELLRHAAAEPPGPAGDRAGGGPAGPGSTPTWACRTLQVGARVPTDVLEHLVALYARTAPAAHPADRHPGGGPGGQRGAARRRCASGATTSRQIEQAAAEALDAVGYRGGALSQGALLAIVGHHGFAVRYVQDLPRSVRSVTDLRNRRIYLKQESMGMHTPRTVLLQTLGHFVLGHAAPRDFADFLRQRVEANYFAAAVLMPGAARPRGSCARPRRPGTCRWRTSGTCSRCRTRWPRTGSPTWPPTTST